MGIGPIWGITSLTFILSCFQQMLMPRGQHGGGGGRGGGDMATLEID